MKIKRKFWCSGNCNKYKMQVLCALGNVLLCCFHFSLVRDTVFGWIFISLLSEQSSGHRAVTGYVIQIKQRFYMFCQVKVPSIVALSSGLVSDDLLPSPCVAMPGGEGLECLKYWSGGSAMGIDAEYGIYVGTFLVV
eukprot:GFUD01104293.1.p1 GENE.GFUD01104293.1~~GFUD01104293.1.p1  ORF type:complete len:137 (+),score=5.64 GFUD01104293.1:113-523(+)